MRKAAVVLLVVLLLAAVLLQWGLDRTPAGTDPGDDAALPQVGSLLDLLGGARQYLAYTFYIKTDEIHHAYYGNLEEEAELIPYFILIAELDPYYVSAYHVGSGIIDRQGKTQEAIDFIRQGLAANPDSADLHFDLGVIQLREKQYEEARESLEKALECEPDTVSRRVMSIALAACYRALGDEESRRHVLMRQAISDQIRLNVDELSYEEYRDLVGLINETINMAMQEGQ